MKEGIIFLGTAGAVASKTRDNTSLLIKTNQNDILVDVPGSIVKKLESLNFNFRKISSIFFTHSHPDHIYGIASLLHSQYRLKNEIEIFAHPKVISLIKTLRRNFKLEDATKYPKLIYHKIFAEQKKPIYDSQDLRVSCFKVKHTPESLGFVFFFKKIKRKIVFSGDTAFSPDLIKESFGCDYLIHDCFAPERIFKKYPQLYNAHTSGQLLGKIAKESQVKALIPIHFASEVKYKIKEIIQDIKKNYSGKIIVPKDLKILKLSFRDCV